MFALHTSAFFFKGNITTFFFFSLRKRTAEGIGKAAEGGQEEREDGTARRETPSGSDDGTENREIRP